jgi:hypothetical protein
MKYWYYFWTANFILAGSAFVFITLVVLVRGVGDLRAMFRGLNERALGGRFPVDTKSEKPH